MLCFPSARFFFTGSKKQICLEVKNRYFFFKCYQNISLHLSGHLFYMKYCKLFLFKIPPPPPTKSYGYVYGV